MDKLKEKQAQLTILGLQIESLTNKFNKLKVEVVNEMDSNQINRSNKKVKISEPIKKGRN